MTDVTAAPSSAPETPAVEVNPFEGANREEFMKTGKMPEPPNTEAPAAPKPREQASATEKVESEPVPDPGIQQEQRRQRKPDAETRIQQLTRENAELQRRLATPAAPSTAAPEKTEPQTLAKPKLDDFTTWEEYETAKDKYYEDLADSKAKAAVAADRQERETTAQQQAMEQQNQKIETSWNQRVKDFTKAHPEAKDFAPAVQAMVDAELIPPGSFLDQWILQSDIGPALAWHFSQNPDAILQIGEMHPIMAARELAKLETSFESKTVPVSKKTTTVLPKPPNEVGARNASTGDEVEEAVNRGDFTSFMAKQNAKDIAAARK